MHRKNKENKIKIKIDEQWKEISSSPKYVHWSKVCSTSFSFARPLTGQLFMLPDNPEGQRHSSSLAARLAVQLAQWRSQHVTASLSVNFEF